MQHKPRRPLQQEDLLRQRTVKRHQPAYRLAGVEVPPQEEVGAERLQAEAVRIPRRVAISRHQGSEIKLNKPPWHYKQHIALGHDAAPFAVVEQELSLLHALVEQPPGDRLSILWRAPLALPLVRCLIQKINRIDTVVRRRSARYMDVEWCRFLLTCLRKGQRKRGYRICDAYLLINKS